MSRKWWILLLLVALAVGGFLWLRGGPSVAQGTVLTLTLEGEYVEARQPPLLARLMGRAETPLVSVLSSLAKARRDDRIHGVVLRIRGLQIGWGKARELRDAVRRLSEAGRETVAYLEIEQYGPNLEYYVASAADRVVMAPAARSPFVGLASEYLFLGGLFEKIGVEIEYERIGKYKSAAETLAGESMSEAHREMANSLLDSVERHFVEGVAEARGLAPDEVRAAIDAGPAAPERMRALGLVDAVLRWEAVLEARGDRPEMTGAAYAAVPPADAGFEPVSRFALVYGTGPVQTGEGQVSPRGQYVFASDTVSSAIEQAAEDPAIDAIVLRVDSPGGSALASDVVWQAVRRARESGTPVVASFSDVAASGGYYAASAADAIVSQPGTYTGSIGVFVLRPNLRGLYEKLGVGVETLLRGEHAELLVSSRPLSESTRERLEADVEEIYGLFLERVAAGREALDEEDVDAVGRGRVWTGAQAAERGLVDALGGLRTAVERGKELAGIDPEADVALQPYPPPRSLAEQLAQALGGSVRLRSELPLPLPERWRELAHTLASVPTGTPVLLPPGLPEVH